MLIVESGKCFLCGVRREDPNAVGIAIQLNEKSRFSFGVHFDCWVKASDLTCSEKLFESNDEWVRFAGKEYSSEYLCVIRKDKTEYYKHGKFHREDGPAIEYTDGSKFWYLNGECHREDGSAAEYSDGTKYWYLRGKEYTRAKYDKKIQKIKRKRIKNESVEQRLLFQRSSIYKERHMPWMRHSVDRSIGCERKMSRRRGMWRI